jgi:hypothetical protein
MLSRTISYWKKAITRNSSGAAQQTVTEPPREGPFSSEAIQTQVRGGLQVLSQTDCDTTASRFK